MLSKSQLRREHELKKHWSFLLGASLITGIAGSVFLKKKNASLPQDSSINLSKQYSGQWWFVNPNKAIQHTLAIDEHFSVQIDKRKLNALLIELTEKRMVIQDEFGYHLIIQCKNRQPVSFYDEADDSTYSLEPVISIDELTDAE